MEKQILKFALVSIFTTWLVLKFMNPGESSEASAIDQANRRIKHQQRGNSNMNYSTPVVVAPKAEGSAYFQPPVQPLTRY